MEPDPGPPRRSRAARPAVRRSPAGPGVRGRHDPPPAQARHQPRPDERPPARSDRRRLDRPRVHRGTRDRLRPPRPSCGRFPGRGRRRSHRDPRRADPHRGRPPRTGRTAAVHGSPGLLPVPPGHRVRRPGQQPAPDPRHARTARVRRPPDERAAHRPEHPRMRGGRRPARLQELGQPPARRGTRQDLERYARPHPARRAAHPPHADDPPRRGRRAAHAVGLRNQPGRLPARTGPHPRRPRSGPALPRGPGPLPDRDHRVRRRGAARRRLG